MLSAPALATLLRLRAECLVVAALIAVAALLFRTLCLYVAMLFAYAARLTLTLIRAVLSPIT